MIKDWYKFVVLSISEEVDLNSVGLIFEANLGKFEVAIVRDFYATCRGGSAGTMIARELWLSGLLDGVNAEDFLFFQIWKTWALMPSQDFSVRFLHYDLSTVFFMLVWIFAIVIITVHTWTRAVFYSHIYLHFQLPFFSIFVPQMATK